MNAWSFMKGLTIIVIISSALGIYYTQEIPTEETIINELCTYEQRINFGYLAHLGENVLYNSTIENGEEILYISLVERIDVDIDCTFHASIRGEIKEAYAVIDSWMMGVDDPWRKKLEIPITSEKNIGTKEAVIKANISYNTAEINNFVERLREEVNAYSMPYRIVTAVRFDVIDEADVGNILETFEAELIFQFVPIGEGGVIHPSHTAIEKEGKLIEEITNINMSMVNLKTGLNWTFAISVLVGFSLMIWRYSTSRKIPETIRDTINVLSVSKDTVTVESMNDLVKIANSYGLKIFRERKDIGYAYTIVKEGVVHQFIEPSLESDTKKELARVQFRE